MTVNRKTLPSYLISLKHLRLLQAQLYILSLLVDLYLDLSITLIILLWMNQGYDGTSPMEPSPAPNSPIRDWRTRNTMLAGKPIITRSRDLRNKGWLIRWQICTQGVQVAVCAGDIPGRSEYHMIGDHVMSLPVSQVPQPAKAWETPNVYRPPRIPL